MNNNRNIGEQMNLFDEGLNEFKQKIPYPNADKIQYRKEEWDAGMG